MSAIEKRIEALAPGEPQRICRLGLHIIRDDLGIDCRIVETRRSRERQAELAGSGDSDVQLGWHNFGRAWDTLIYIGGVLQHDDATGIYTHAGRIWQVLGCRWPIRIRRGVDLGHVEWRPDFVSLDEYVAKMGATLET